MNDAEQIRRLVGDRRYCCVIMPYRSLGSFYHRIREVVERETNLLCIRADDIPGSGQSLLGKIHRMIGGAEIVLAELSQPSPNVYYEVGYAAARDDAKVLIVCHESTPLPTDLQGLERITYLDTPQDLPRFEKELAKQLSVMLDSDLEWLRAMLVAPDQNPTYLLASPRGSLLKKLPEGKKRPGRYPERFTHGDNLGVLGILSALGRILREDEERPHVITAKAADPKLFEEDNNLYLLGSPRTIKGVGAKMLDELQRDEPDAARRWQFPDPDNDKSGVLTGWTGSRAFECKVSRAVSIPKEDYGLILRGARKDRPNRRIWIIAGTRSFGTGGASIAATTPRFIEEIATRLKRLDTPVDLATCAETIWALVRVQPDQDDYGRVTEERIEIDSVGAIPSKC